MTRAEHGKLKRSDARFNTVKLTGYLRKAATYLRLKPPKPIIDLLKTSIDSFKTSINLLKSIIDLLKTNIDSFKTTNHLFVHVGNHTGKPLNSAYARAFLRHDFLAPCHMHSL